MKGSRGHHNLVQFVQQLAKRGERKREREREREKCQIPIQIVSERILLIARSFFI
jgi:hypothetical protein